jgi:hypothetical protein
MNFQSSDRIFPVASSADADVRFQHQRGNGRVGELSSGIELGAAADQHHVRHTIGGLGNARPELASDQRSSGLQVGAQPLLEGPLGH